MYKGAKSPTCVHDAGLSIGKADLFRFAVDPPALGADELDQERIPLSAFDHYLKGIIRNLTTEGTDRRF